MARAANYQPVGLESRRLTEVKVKLKKTSRNLVAALLVASLALTGCGDDDDNGDNGDNGITTTTLDVGSTTAP